ncbi:MAG TPA: SsrA-binding protein SmpB [Cytophagaceae bacterium]
MSKQKIYDKVNIKNKKAGFEYHLLDSWTAGIQLSGTEIKSIRQGKVNLSDAYCMFMGDELFVRNMHIAKYEEGSHYNHEPLRDRKLLLQKRELKKMKAESQENGITIIPVRLFINDRGLAKLDVAVAKGKKLYDKRESIKERDVKREMSREKY